MLHPLVAATLQDVAKTNHIALEIGRWVIQRIANTWLSSQVNDSPRRFSGEQRGQRLAILKIELLKTKQLRSQRQRLKPLQTGPLEGRRVIGIQVVEAHDPLAALQQPCCHGSSNKPGDTGDQDGAGGPRHPIPTRHTCKPAAWAAAQSTTDRASNNQAGFRISGANCCQSN